jgi:excisionase family DNA binding protein
MLGTMDAATIAAKLSEQFPWPRTETAVKSRVKVLRLSLLVVRPMSRREVEHALGVSDDTIVAWIAQGLLVGTPWKLGGGQRKANISRAFTRAEVEAFVRTHPELVQVARIRDRGFRALVEGVTRGRRPLTIKEAARLANVEYGTLMYWCKHGKVPSAYQVDGRHWRISATDLPLLRSMPDQRTQAAQSTRVRRADGTYAPSETAPPVIRVLDRSEAQRRLVGEVAS